MFNWKWNWTVESNKAQCKYHCQSFSQRPFYLNSTCTRCNGSVVVPMKVWSVASSTHWHRCRAMCLHYGHPRTRWRVNTQLLLFTGSIIRFHWAAGPQHSYTLVKLHKHEKQNLTMWPMSTVYIMPASPRGPRWIQAAAAVDGLIACFHVKGPSNQSGVQPVRWLDEQEHYSYLWNTCSDSLAAQVRRVFPIKRDAVNIYPPGTEPRLHWWFKSPNKPTGLVRI